MDDKELGRMLRLEKVEENTFQRKRQRSITKKSMISQIPSEETIRPEVFARMPEE